MLTIPINFALTGPEVIQNKFMLSSAENENFPAHNVKMPTVVGILTFMSRKSSIQGLSKPEKG